MPFDLTRLIARRIGVVEIDARKVQELARWQQAQSAGSGSLLIEPFRCTR
jgi:hypothetical protein